MKTLIPPDRLRLALDNAAETIIKLSERIVEMEKKHGTSAKFIDHDRKTHAAFKELYQACVSDMRASSKTIKMMAIILRAQDIDIAARQLGCTTAVAMRILGYEMGEPKVSQLDRIDQVIESCKGLIS